MEITIDDIKDLEGNEGEESWETDKRCDSAVANALCQWQGNLSFAVIESSGIWFHFIDLSKTISSHFKILCYDGTF